VKPNLVQTPKSQSNRQTLDFDLEGVEHVSDMSGSLDSFGDDSDDSDDDIPKKESADLATTVSDSSAPLSPLISSPSMLYMRSLTQSSRNITTAKLKTRRRC
jgi:hypothetical protein